MILIPIPVPSCSHLTLSWTSMSIRIILFLLLVIEINVIPANGSSHSHSHSRIWWESRGYSPWWDNHHDHSSRYSLITSSMSSPHSVIPGSSTGTTWMTKLKSLPHAYPSLFWGFHNKDKYRHSNAPLLVPLIPSTEAEWELYEHGEIKVWQEYQQWDIIAKRKQDEVDRSKSFMLYLTVVGAGLQTLGSQLQLTTTTMARMSMSMSMSMGWMCSMTGGACLALLPLLSSKLSKNCMVNKTNSRLIANLLESEVHKSLAKVGPYGDHIQRGYHLKENAKRIKKVLMNDDLENEWMIISSGSGSSSSQDQGAYYDSHSHQDDEDTDTDTDTDTPAPAPQRQHQHHPQPPRIRDDVCYKQWYIQNRLHYQISLRREMAETKINRCRFYKAVQFTLATLGGWIGIVGGAISASHTRHDESYYGSSSSNGGGGNSYSSSSGSKNDEKKKNPTTTIPVMALSTIPLRLGLGLWVSVIAAASAAISAHCQWTNLEEEVARLVHSVKRLEEEEEWRDIQLLQSTTSTTTTTGTGGSNGNGDEGKAVQVESNHDWNRFVYCCESILNCDSQPWGGFVNSGSSGSGSIGGSGAGGLS